MKGVGPFKEGMMRSRCLSIPLPPRAAAGFSLIELIVTISIIAVLIGILIPVLPRVIDSSRRAACGANLRSVGQAFEMHKGQHRDEYPKAKYMPAPWLSGDTDPSLNDAMAPYMDPKSEGWRCPGDSIVYDYEYTDASGERKISGSSYTFIVMLSGRRFEDSAYARFLRRTPTDSPVVYDYDGGTFETQTGDMVQVGFFHGSRSVLFVDGHVGPPPETAR